MYRELSSLLYYASLGKTFDQLFMSQRDVESLAESLFESVAKLKREIAAPLSRIQ